MSTSLLNSKFDLSIQPEYLYSAYQILLLFVSKLRTTRAWIRLTYLIFQTATTIPADNLPPMVAKSLPWAVLSSLTILVVDERDPWGTIWFHREVRSWRSLYTPPKTNQTTPYDGWLGRAPPKNILSVGEEEIFRDDIR
uniref:Similar to n=1 Tax=Heterorhabditis bacteriophora TaxID=37862 RepID=A0A1I7WRV2_HETBA